VGEIKGVRSNGVLVPRDARKIIAPAAAIAIHEQQTRIATIAAIILGVDDED
jgi:hypothetical protein